MVNLNTKMLINVDMRDNGAKIQLWTDQGSILIMILGTF